MGKINILQDNISSKIAAGEVIDRPVSVVKELLENSIDANSKNINIEIKQGGKNSIKVIDDGEGIFREDAKLAFERHATSKINKLDDIFNINTLGFRGEALASIASISIVEMFTKTAKELVGTRCIVYGGILKEIDDAPANNGCSIEVKDLFFNTPARLKFLSSNTQEASYITDFVTKLAIGNPQISFRLTSDGKEIFFSSGNGDYREVIAKVYGVDIAKRMIHIKNSLEHGDIFGYISPPQFNRGNRSGQIFFVNQRFIKDKRLTFSLERAYKTLLPIGRFPVAIVHINIKPTLVDVNIHPSKTEIKFQKENEIQSSLYNCITRNLRSNILIPQEKINIPNKKEIKIFHKVPENETFLNNEYYLGVSEKIKNIPEGVFEQTQEEYIHKPENNSKKITITKVLGQLFNTYIVVQGEDELYLIDQHAAHERILFDTYLNKFYKPQASQKLVEPYTLHIPVQDIDFIEIYKENIEKIGFDISVFGKDTILIRSVPYLFNRTAEPTVLQDILDTIKSTEHTGLNLKERFIVSMACHTAIKAGDVLSSKEINELLTQLMNLENPYTCPHGRPTIISITLYELEKKFRRVQ